MNSCRGCKYLYGQGEGYSNWTWEDTEVRCAKGKNANLPASEPSDWKEPDNWPATENSRCELYAAGVYLTLDVDGEDKPADYTDDAEAIEAICADSGRPK